MIRILTRLYESLLGMTIMILSIHVLGICLGLIVSFFIWENPIDVFVKGFTNLWRPITEGWTISNIISLVLWFGLGLVVTGLDVK